MKNAILLLATILILPLATFAQSKELNGKWKIKSVSPAKHEKQTDMDLAALSWLNIESIGSTLEFKDGAMWVNGERKSNYIAEGSKLLVDKKKNEGYIYSINGKTLTLVTLPKKDSKLILVKE